MPLKTQHDDMPQLNLTSMIDVVFLLIVFFMAAAKFSDVERDIDLKLPEVAKADAAHAAAMARQVAVFPGGRFALDNQDVTLPELTERLAQAIDDQPGVSVVILGDAACDFQHVAEALAACKEAGVSQLAVSVRVGQGATGVRR
jgi:biopolymer transport protein ExbD